MTAVHEASFQSCAFFYFYDGNNVKYILQFRISCKGFVAVMYFQAHYHLCLT